MSSQEEFREVVVIGAGASGLYAAQQLKARCPDVLIVEATERIGGRIHEVHGLAPWPIQAGAEFVHGSNSLFVDSLKAAGYKFTEREWPDWWFFSKEKKLVHDEHVDSEVGKVHDLFEKCDVKNMSHPLTDVAVRDWMKQQGASERMIAVADACYANDFGCSIAQLGLTEMIEESRGWDSGETYLITDRCLTGFLAKMAQGLDVRTRCPVERIEYGGPEWGVRLHCSDGRKIRCKRAIVTASLRIIQDGVITFTPTLPEPKLAALSRIRMGNAIKIILTFKKRFWPEKMYDLICTDSFVPEMWMLKYQETAPGQGFPNVITGFIAGEKAAAVSRMTEQEAISAFLEQLDTIFASEGNPKPATTSLGRSIVCDWSKEHYFRGAYTYPTLGAHLGDRDTLAAPVSGTIFFAGEATNTVMNPCIQGAMVTGHRAALQVLGSLDVQPTSRL